MLRCNSNSNWITEMTLRPRTIPWLNVQTQEAFAQLDDTCGELEGDDLPRGERKGAGCCVDTSYSCRACNFANAGLWYRKHSASLWSVKGVAHFSARRLATANRSRVNIRVRANFWPPDRGRRPPGKIFPLSSQRKTWSPVHVAFRRSRNFCSALLLHDVSGAGHSVSASRTDCIVIINNFAISADLADAVLSAILVN